jgi:hypothetical protein
MAALPEKERYPDRRRGETAADPALVHLPDTKRRRSPSTCSPSESDENSSVRRRRGGVGADDTIAHAFAAFLVPLTWLAIGLQDAGTVGTAVSVGTATQRLSRSLVTSGHVTPVPVPQRRVSEIGPSRPATGGVAKPWRAWLEDGRFQLFVLLTVVILLLLNVALLWRVGKLEQELVAARSQQPVDLLQLQAAAQGAAEALDLLRAALP